MLAEKADIERFNKKWQPITETGCWIWDGSDSGRRYGRFFINGKNAAAHRVSYTIHNGNIPKDMNVCHKCDTPACVNPDHLFIGTQSDNMLDREAKNRANRKKQIQITGSMIKEIRDLAKNDQMEVSEIAKKYDINERIVWWAINYEGWELNSKNYLT